MDNKIDIIRELQLLIDARGVPCTTSDVFTAIHNVAVAAAHSTIQRLPPPPAGPMGMKGEQGNPGTPGVSAFDKYRWDRSLETLVEFSWKGIVFSAPVPIDWAKEIPSGPLNFGDIAFIQMMYGTKLVERMATFWRREFDVREDMSLFINEEELCNLKDIHRSSSFPDPLPDCWAKLYRQSVMENPSGT